MAYNFPNSPSNGDTVTISNVTYTYNSTSGAWKTTAAGGASGASVTSSDTAPSSPSAGDLWYDTTTLRLYVYYNDGSSSQWVKANPSGSSGALVQETAPSNPASGNLWFDPSTLETYVYYNDGDSNQWVQTNPAASSAGTTVYSSIDDLPLSGVETGAQAFVSSTSRLYLWNGTGWYNIALINTTPSISGASSAYTLASDGTATTVTITATDPEGLPITYSIASDTSGNVATVTQGTGSNTNVFTITPSTNTANAGTFSLTFRASDGVNIATAISEFTLQFSVANSNYTTALITSVGANNAVNNSFTDSSSNSHTITANGNVTQNTFSPYRHGGYSTYFDGTGDYLKVASNSTFNWYNTDFTIEGWFNASAPGTNEHIFASYIDVNNRESLYLPNATTLRWWVNGTTRITATIAANEWYHFAIVDNNGTTTLYLNGVSQGTWTSTYTDGNRLVWIGTYNDASVASDSFTGYISDVRFVKGTAVYTSAFTPPTERLTAITNTSLLTCHLPYIADGSTNSHSITVNGNTKTEPFGPYDYSEYSASVNAGSAYFDGTGDYLNAGTDSSLALGSGDFTFECWIYPPTATMATYAAIYSNTSEGQGDSNALRFGNLATSSTTLAVQTAASSIFNSTSGAVKVGQWNHVALVRNGTATNNMTIYVNGVASGQGTSTANFSTGYATIGTNVYAGVHYLYSGYIADVRVVQGTAVYTSAFTPPTAPLTAISGTGLLLPFDGAGIIDKSQSVKTLTLNGDVKSSTTQSKYLTSSMYFDGTGDSIATNLDDTLPDDFTLECWIYASSAWSNYRTIFDSRINANAVDRIFVGAFTTSGEIHFYTTATIIKATNVPDSQWVHFAISRESGTLKMFIDGTLAQSASSITQAFYVPRLIGNSFDGYGWQGYISDARITKGLARYTSNFTPPTAALGG